MRKWTPRIGLLMLAAMLISAGVGCHSHRNKYRDYRYDDDCYDRRPARECYSAAPDYRGGSYSRDYHRPVGATHLSWEAREWVAAQRGGHGAPWRR